ncbi:hypothetical protein [Formosa sp. L2A11]|uniref:hypothetical protein n=1 Tax=Formosa sp. L2A11 TaxID=2686363 RepID=UPI0018EF2988|nr:hypothetical protein [Formosa sp. L2A11]
MKKTDEGLIKNSYENIIGELQTIITIAYILTVGIGMLFSFQKYRPFGINIFEYSDIFDFLITPFSDFKVLGFSIISLILSLIIIKIDVYIKRNKPKFYSKVNMGLDKKKWFEPVMFIFYTSLTLGYLYTASIFYGNTVKNEIEKQPEIQVKFIDGEVKTGTLIGKTSEILFLKKKDKITAIPIKSMLKEIEIK